MEVQAGVGWLERALGLAPFPWQERLFQRFCRDDLPRALDLPTGMGKTAVMAIWLAARAAGARRLPRRLVYVVDRRAVVDQATSVAEALRAWAQDPDVAHALGLTERGLAISTLRGKFVDNREWLEDPVRPALVVGTVDMIGSRLLFEGYGTSRRMRPYQAAFLGSDTLFVLDEAHLVPPFERLLESVTGAPSLRGNGTQRDLVPTPRLLSLSATGRAHKDALRLDADDLEHSVVRRRVHAPKRLELRSAETEKVLPEVLAAAAWELAGAADGPVRVLVYANSRAVAEAAKAAVEALAHAERDRGADLPATELFVGARRVRERQRAAERLRELGFLAGSDRPTDHAFVFATSAGEVGVDLDADHLVGDVVAWERVVQRLGRVNRRGDGEARVVVVRVDDRTDPIPGTDGVSEDDVLALLRRLPGTDGAHDASPAALGALRDAHAQEIVAASTPEPLYPVLARAQLDDWSQTTLGMHPGRPEVAPWLRGWVASEPETELAWRSRLPPPRCHERLVRAYFEAAPIHTSERLAAPTGRRVIPLLQERVKQLAKHVERDHQGLPAPEDAIAFVLDRAGELRARYSLRDLQQALREANSRKRLERELASTTLVLDARLGGLSEDGLLDNREAAAPVTAECRAPEDPPWLPSTASDEPTVRFRVVERTEPEAIDDPNWRERWRAPIATDAENEQPTRWLVVEKWRHDASLEDDRATGRPQLLDEHHAWTRDAAARIGAALELPERFRGVLELVARLHDEGKRAARWQRAFRAPGDGVWAKTRGPVDQRELDGYRHEFGSLAWAQTDAELEGLDPEQQALALHMIAAHHGWARPLISSAGCEDAPPSQLEERAREVALRFYDLQERWGPWGLAWWESLLRAADQQASRTNDAREAARREKR